MKIKRAQILKALRTEPLRQGHFVESDLLPEIGTCNVCAVGAVLRSAGVPDRAINGVAVQPQVIGFADCCFDSSNKAEQKLELAEDLAERRYLAALSKVFEAAPKRTAKAQAIAFVKKHFPKEIRIPDTVITSAKLHMFDHIVQGLQEDGFESPVDLFDEDGQRKESHEFTPAQRTKIIKAYSAFLKARKAVE